MTVEIIPAISRIVVTGVTNLLTFLLLGNIYGEKYNKKSLYIAAYLITVILTVIVNEANISYLNVLFSFITINTVCFLLYESNLKKTWLTNLILWFIYIFCDSITVLIWSAIKGNTLAETLSDGQLMLGSNILNIIFMFAAYRIYLSFISKSAHQSIQLKIALFMFTTTSFETWAVVTFASHISDNRGGVQVIIVLIGFLAINLFL